MKLETEFLLSSSVGRPAETLHDNFEETPLLAKARLDSALAGTLQQLIDDLPEQIAVLDEKCNIVAANQAWTRIVAEHGYTNVGPGDNYRAFCAEMAAQGYPPAAKARDALDDISSGKRTYWELFYNGLDRWSGHDFQISFHRMNVGAETFISVTRFDVTELVELRKVKADFSHSLVEGQTVERQRLGRELHDSTSQLLTAVALLLGRLRRESPNQDCLGLVDELQELVREAQQEIRSISYLAHPPSLGRLGLAAAVKSLTDGFGQRTGLLASFETQGKAVPIPESAESALYRIAQEALSNVHRHAHAEQVRVLLYFGRSAMHLLIVDDGAGISAEARAGIGHAGVGLAGMRSRLAEIGGRLTIRRRSPGTAIIASVRRERRSATSKRAWR